MTDPLVIRLAAVARELSLQTPLQPARHELLFDVLTLLALCLDAPSTVYWKHDAIQLALARAEAMIASPDRRGLSGAVVIRGVGS